MSFWGELKRRNVYKVGVAYAIVAWLIVQATAIVSPALHLPEWTLPFVIIFLSIGFIVTLFLAWAYEVTPEGIKRTKEVPLSESITHLTGKRLNYILSVLLVLAVAFLLFDNYYLDRRASETKQVPATDDTVEAPKTIAVLPFDDLSPEKDQEYFVLGLSEEILNSLAQIPDLTVIAKTSSFSFKGKDKTIQEIASILGVENILEGSVRKAGNALRITAQLVKSVDGAHLWSKTYDKEFKVEEMFSVQEDIATAVANELKVKLGIGKSFKQLGGTDNVEAYELYLVAQGQSNNSSYDRALESIDSAIALDPEFALAWALKAIIYWQRSKIESPNIIDSEYGAALNAANRAIELEPNFGKAYLSLGAIHMARGEFVEAELAYRKGKEFVAESIDYVEYGLHRLYSVVGYLRKYNELLEEVRENDPLNGNYRGWYILSLGLLGDIQRAEEEYERCKVLFGYPWNVGDTHMTLARLRSGKILSRDEIPEFSYTGHAWNTAREYSESPEKGLTELRRLYATDDKSSSGNYIMMSIWAAYFGDPEFALNAMEKGCEIEASGVFFVWLPVMHEVRQLPRFKEFVREIGLVDYWNKFGWPDICHQLDNGDFECD